MLDISIQSFLKAVLYSMIVTNYMWLFGFKLIKIKIQFHSCTSHISSALCG